MVEDGITHEVVDKGGVTRDGGRRGWGTEKFTGKGKGKGCKDLVSRQKKIFLRIDSVNNNIGIGNKSSPPSNNLTPYLG